MKMKSFIPKLILLSILLTSCFLHHHTHIHIPKILCDTAMSNIELFDPNIVYTGAMNLSPKKNYGSIRPSIFQAVKIVTIYLLWFLKVFI